MNWKKIARIVFWLTFIPAAIVTGIYSYYRGMSQRVDLYIERMAHPNAKVASEAWINLRELYMTSWDAYGLVLEHINDDTPISFLIEIEKMPVPGKPAQDNFWANGKPIYYKADTVYCRTIGEAILAFVHNEPKWKTPYDGDWNAWWENNKGYYGK